MRSSILLTSAMAMGAVAGPINLLKRYIVTEIDLEIVTKTVYVTPGQPLPTDTPTAAAYGSNPKPKPSSSTSCTTSSLSSAPAPIEPAPSSYEPAPSSYQPAPVPSSSSVYTPPVQTPSPTPTPTPTPEPQPSNTPEPAPESSSVPAPTSPAPTPAPTAPAGEHQSGEDQATLSAGPEYQAAVLYHHNAARANHGAGALEWDDLCADYARQAAQRCDFEHYFPTEDAGQGQNLFTVSGDAFNATAGITESWYKAEFELMTQNNLWGAKDIPESIFHEVGHLTQMVWKSTTKVGCYSQHCATNMTVGGSPSEMNKYTVCNYAGPGNYGGEYANQVGIPVSTSNLGSWSD